MEHVKAERNVLAEVHNPYVVKLYFSFQVRDGGVCMPVHQTLPCCTPQPRSGPFFQLHAAAIIHDTCLSACLQGMASVAFVLNAATLYPLHPPHGRSKLMIRFPHLMPTLLLSLMPALTTPALTPDTLTPCRTRSTSTW